MTPDELSKVNDVALTARPLWLARMFGFVALFGLFVVYHAAMGNMHVPSEIQPDTRGANMVERLVLGAFGLIFGLIGTLVAYSRAHITLCGSVCEARVKYVYLCVPWSCAPRSCRRFTKVRIERWVFATRFLTALTFRVSLEGEGEEPLWLGDYMGTELAGGRPFFMDHRSPQ